VHPEVLRDKDAVEPSVLVAVVVSEASLAGLDEAQCVDQIRSCRLPELSRGEVPLDRGRCCSEAVKVWSLREVPVSQVDGVGDGGQEAVLLLRGAEGDEEVLEPRCPGRRRLGRPVLVEEGEGVPTPLQFQQLGSAIRRG